MTSLFETVGKLTAIRAELVSASANVIEALKDTSIPLDERWKAFTKLVEAHILVNEESYGDGELRLLGDNFTMYDDFNTDRGQSMTYPEMYDIFIGWGTEDDWSGNEALAPEVIEAWQEHVLERGFSSFTHDW